MIASKRPLLVFLFTNAIALSLVFALVISCKKDDPGTPSTNASIQGNWRLTAINVSPAFTYSGLPFTEVVTPLNGLENNCVGNTTLSFNNNTVTNNAASVTACNNATISKQLLSTFFSTTTGAAATYSEDGNQLTIRGSQTVTATKSVNSSTATLITNLPVNPLNQPTPTSYTLTMTKL